MHEMKSELLETLGIDVCMSTICNFLSKNGFTRQKLYSVAIQQDQYLRQLYVSDVSVFSSDMFIFVDETGTDKRNLQRKFAYSIRGKPLRDHSLFMRGERISSIAAISTNGLLDVKTVHGTTDGTDFYDFINSQLLPHLLPFNGINHHSIVVLDNCSINHIVEVSRIIHQVGALVIFHPPYYDSPDYNPIEETFSKVKNNS